VKAQWQPGRAPALCSGNHPPAPEERFVLGCWQHLDKLANAGMAMTHGRTSHLSKVAQHTVLPGGRVTAPVAERRGAGCGGGEGGGPGVQPFDGEGDGMAATLTACGCRRRACHRPLTRTVGLAVCRTDSSSCTVPGRLTWRPAALPRWRERPPGPWHRCCAGPASLAQRPAPAGKVLSELCTWTSLLLC